jgi:hypothetical protein
MTWSCSRARPTARIRFLEKTLELSDFQLTSGPVNFWYISSLSCDHDNNLYVADSGWNKILVFSPSGVYLRSVGDAGQGPGEFMASPEISSLRISHGLDGRFYVLDSANKRLSVFDRNLAIDGTYRLSSQGPSILDVPHANAQGEVFLVSYYQGSMIQCFGQDLRWQRGIMPSALHFKNLFAGKPVHFYDFFTNEHFISKVLTKTGLLWAVSNYALHAYCFNDRGELLKDIDLSENEYFMDDFKVRMKNRRDKDGKILPFVSLLDHQGNLGVGYYLGKTKNWEILRYTEDLVFKDVLRTQDIIFPPFISDGLGNYYMLNQDHTCIYQYHIKEE